MKIIVLTSLLILMSLAHCFDWLRLTYFKSCLLFVNEKTNLAMFFI